MSAAPGKGCGDDGIVVAAGRRAVAPGTAGQALEGEVFQFVEQDRVVEQADVAALDGQGKGFDERWFGFGGGDERFDGQAFADEGIDIGFADAVGFGPDDLRPPMVDEGFEAVALEVPADLIEALEGHHFGVGGIDDGDGGEVVAASPINAGDVGMAGLGMRVAVGGDGVVNAAEDLVAGVGELRQVFGFPDMFGCDALDFFQFLLGNERVGGGGEMKGFPIGLQRIAAELVEVAEPVGTVGRAENERFAACW